MGKSLPIDTKGKPFTKQAFWLEPAEYSKITSEINQLYSAVYEDKAIAAHTSFGIDGNAYIYWFENHGYDDYNIFMRVIDNH